MINPSGSPTSNLSGLQPEDFYKEGGYVVFTEAFHLKRGYCCGHGCRHCPFDQAMPKYSEPAKPLVEQA